MSDLLFDRERAALVELRQLLEERRHGEDELSVSSAQQEQAAVEKGTQDRQALASNHDGELAELDASFLKEEEEVLARQKAEAKSAQKAAAEKLKSLEAAEQETRSRVGGELRDALWLAESIAEGGQKRVQQQLDKVRHQVTVNEERIAALWKDAEPLLARFDLERADVEPSAKTARPAADITTDPNVPLGRAEMLLRDMLHLRVLPWTRWPATIGLAAMTFVVVSAPAAFLQLHVLALVSWVLCGIMAGFLVGLVSRILFYAVARRQVRALGRKLLLLLAQTHDLGTQLMAQTEPWAAAERASLRAKHEEERQRAQAKHRPQLNELKRRLDADRAALEQQYKTSAQARREADRQALEVLRQNYQLSRSSCLERHTRERQENDETHAEALNYVKQTHLEKARQLAQRWETEAGRLCALFTELQHSEARGNGTALVSVGELSFGSVAVDVRQFSGDLTPEKLAPLPLQSLELPAFLPFPRLGGLLLHAFGTGRMSAIQTLQALMLRFLTTLPPGKVRFTIFDSVGLGDNFAAFMHLADHDEALVSGRIWTEPSHIEKQLADLTIHMENVIQKYLRSQFSSIEDYNAQAGEVAEPYRILVVANFPVNFTPQAARRLVSIVQSGSSCGVYALISLDTRQTLPQDFELEDLEQLCLNLYWRDEQFHWSDGELDRHALTLETPPEASQVVEMVRRVGALSRDASRVRVPFSFIAPTEEEIWQQDSRRGVSVPLGRAGAVNRRSLELGKGTAQHVLVAGKTGSGKSTLWHALIANASLLYSPDELELYLIDFKKGVEFKLYALCELPQARVIAIESEREFGLSVLQRLDAELRHRSDLFRSAGVNDIASYRDNQPGVRCPRILFIVDEFQEFFVEDDRLSQEAALLLDRLVRQGRAFGLHVLLGSQTLGGAYSLARSTIDQMAVRIALQCSEADAQLILNKDNSAARLLSRPGEAIYNDANGAIEANEVFQVVWLPEEEREQILQQVQRRAAQDSPNGARRLPLVFEGNTPAELDRNPLLLRLLEVNEAGRTEDSAHRLPSSAFGKAWLGDAIAIKDPTAALFRRQTSDNLLIVGQNDEAARALLTSALVGLSAQQPTAQFVVLDGTAEHQPYADYLREVLQDWPQPATLVDRNQVAAQLAGLADEMNQRLKGTSTDRSSRYVLLNGLHLYREFRRSDDDLGFGRRGAERTISPLEHLQALLRDGPTVGIHLLLWCDSLVNVMRSLDRAGLRECGQRVLFQMNAADSSHLLDSPAASRLGPTRALYNTDEAAQPEKFRPYGMPSLVWLTEVKRRLAERVRKMSPQSA